MFPLQLVGMVVALVALSVATFLVADVSMIAACLLGGVGCAAIVAWASLGGRS